MTIAAIPGNPQQASPTPVEAQPRIADASAESATAIERVIGYPVGVGTSQVRIANSCRAAPATPSKAWDAGGSPAMLQFHHGPTGLGTSAARNLKSSLSSSPLGEHAAPTDARAPSGEGAVVVLNEPRLNRSDVATIAAPLRRNALGPELIVPGRSRLLFPTHWQSLYVHGNRYTDLLERGTVDWLHQFGLITTPEDAQTIKEFECGLYGGLSSPASNLRDGLILTQFVSLWLYFDDRVIEDSDAWSMDDPVTFQGTQASFGGPSGFLSAWRDLCERMRRTQSEAWMTRLGEALKAWIANAKLETENARVRQSTGKLPPFATMLEIRTISIGMYPNCYLLELAEGFELPDCVHDSPTVIELKRLASRLVGFGNEIGGLGKDLARDWPNLVVAFKEEHGISLENAFDQVIRMHNADVENFDAVERELPSWGPDLDLQIKEWVQAMRYSVHGFTLWESLAARYQKYKAIVGDRVLAAPVTLFGPSGVSPGRPPDIDATRTIRVGV